MHVFDLREKSKLIMKYSLKLFLSSSHPSPLMPDPHVLRYDSSLPTYPHPLVNILISSPSSFATTHFTIHIPIPPQSLPSFIRSSQRCGNHGLLDHRTSHLTLPIYLFMSSPPLPCVSLSLHSCSSSPLPS